MAFFDASEAASDIPDGRGGSLKISLWQASAGLARVVLDGTACRPALVRVSTES